VEIHAAQKITSAAKVKATVITLVNALGPSLVEKTTARALRSTAVMTAVSAPKKSAREMDGHVKRSFIRGTDTRIPIVSVVVIRSGVR